MFHFLRKIRRTLLENNKMKKYVFYALGEVMLVVVGILIAVQLGNLNQQRKDKKEEQFILQSLEEDFQTNLELLNKDIETNQSNLNDVFRLLEIIREQKASPDLNEINKLFANLSSWGTVDFNTGSIDEMKNSGKLQILQNELLRNKLSGWQAVVDELQKEGDIMVGHYTKVLIPLLAKIYPLVSTDKLNFPSDIYSRPNLPKSNNKFDITDLYSLEIESLLYAHAVNFDYILIADLEAKEKVKALLILIAAGLKSE